MQCLVVQRSWCGLTGDEKGGLPTSDDSFMFNEDDDTNNDNDIKCI